MTYSTVFSLNSANTLDGLNLTSTSIVEIPSLKDTSVEVREYNDDGKRTYDVFSLLLYAFNSSSLHEFIWASPP